MAATPTSRDHTKARDTAELLLEEPATKMVQEFMVVRCHQCETFQVQQVKKVNKWSCKCCNEKQSVVKVYGKGKAADCRKHVQKLNMMRGERDQADVHTVLSTSNHPPEDYASTFTPLDEAGSRGDETPDHPVVVAGKLSGKSKWATFIDVQDSDEEDNEESCTTDRAEFTQASKRVKRSTSDRVRSQKTEQATPTDKVVPYSSFNKEMEEFLDDHTPSMSASKSLYALPQETYRRLDTDEAAPTNDMQSHSMLDLRGHSYHDDIETIRKDISRFSRPTPAEDSDIPKVSSRWSKFMCAEDTDGDEAEGGSGLSSGPSQHLLAGRSTVAQFTMNNTQ